MQTQNHLPLRLTKIINSIEKEESITNDHLIKMIKDSGITAQDLDAFYDFGHDPSESYGRKILYTGRNFTIYLMSWAPGDFTAIHSHGLSDWGAVLLLGTTFHRLYEVSNTQITLKSADIIPEGTVVGIKGDLVHAMGNLASKGVMTLHIYGSKDNLSNANDFSKVYDLERKLIKTTNGAAFINIAENLVKKTDQGLTCDKATLLDYLQIVRPVYLRMNNAGMVKVIDTYLQDPSLY